MARRKRPWRSVPAVRVLYNHNLTLSSVLVLPVIAVASMMVGVVQLPASIVRETELGPRQLVLVTPITTPELFLATTLPALVMCLLALFPALLVSQAFDAPMRGSVRLFVAMRGFCRLNAIALRPMIATFARTPQQVLLLAFVDLFALMFLSGTLAPIEGMLRTLQYATLARPLRHYVDMVLGIVVQSVGLDVLWPQALARVGAT